MTFDYMFTEVFNNPKNICVLEEFISYYLDISLNKVKGNLKLLSRNLKKKNKLSSKKEVDLLLDLNGKKYNIEMSNKWNEGIKDRNLIYLSKIHGEQIKEGFYKYDEIEESIQINLNNFDSEEELKTTYYLRNDKGKIFSKKFRIDIINLEKGKNMSYTNDEKVNTLINWCKVFTSKTEEELKESLKNIVSRTSKKKLIEDVNRLSGDDEMIDIYGYKDKRDLELRSIIEEEYDKKYEEKYQKKLQKELQKELQKGLEQGLEQGIEQGKFLIATNLLKQNVSLDIIISSTGLTKDEIEKLR